MRFKITRTSQWKDEQPHPRAVSTMDREQVYWFIDVKDLEDLLSIASPDIIVIARKFRDCVGIIEIYDDYRE